MEKEKKVRIIKAAQKRFVRHGLNKTTLDEIARDLRMGKATIYHYFNSKEDLYYQTLEWEALQYLDEAAALTGTGGISAVEKLKALFELKENLNKKYPLIFEAALCLFRDIDNEKERAFTANLIKKEEEIIKKGFARHLTEINKTAPFLVMQSWGMMFCRHMNAPENGPADMAEQLLEMLPLGT